MQQLPLKLIQKPLLKLQALWQRPVQKLPLKLQALLRKLHPSKREKPLPQWQRPRQKPPPLLLLAQPLRILKLLLN
ncbi:MAG: hypothetical protein VYB22_03530 [Pseudomonadota bacterium]|nr:hypothetical protein [Pseudomonadota bacterium]